MSIEAIVKYFRGSIKSKFNLGNYSQKYLQTETDSLVVIDISQKKFLYSNRNLLLTTLFLQKLNLLW